MYMYSIYSILCPILLSIHLPQSWIFPRWMLPSTTTSRRGNAWRFRVVFGTGCGMGGIQTVPNGRWHWVNPTTVILKITKTLHVSWSNPDFWWLLSSMSFKSWLPSGKLSHNYGKSPFLMGKSTISMAIFNSYVKLPEGRYINQLDG